MAIRSDKRKKEKEMGPVTPPTDLDMEFIEANSDSGEYEIPYFFDREQWKTNVTYRIRVSHIYDPSKFWIVFKDKELDYFQQYMHNYFTKFREHFKVPVEKLKPKMYCVAHSDQSFYRGILVDIPSPLSQTLRAYIFLIDWGCICKIPLEDIYYLPKSMFSVPRFAVRACLEGLASHDMKPWTTEAVAKFGELVTGKVLLAIIMHIDETRRVLNIDIGDINVKSKVIEITDVSEILVRENFAKVLRLPDVKDNKEIIHSGKFLCKTKYPYMFPSFDSIENHEVPDSVIVTKILNENLLLDYQFKTLYVFKN